MEGLVKFYKENADILRQTFSDMGFSVYGGANAPYIWIGFPGQVLPYLSLPLPPSKNFDARSRRFSYHWFEIL